MCGIAGIFDLVGERTIDRRLLKEMNDRQFHRGPDGEGFHFEPGVGLGHRRLSIIDLAGGGQPMFNEDGSVVVTYNGEIYEFAELMDELRAAGHVFATHCDTEVIVHAWEEWGEACLGHLSGMFAFGLWDRNRQTLFLARDRFGKKPLYYSRLDDETLIFGSELKVLLAHPRAPRQIDPEALEEYLTFGYVPDPKTIFKGVYKLPPGFFLKVERGAASIEPKQYWDVSFESRTSVPDETALCDEFIRRLDKATQKRMIADVPLGAFLSGGVDSSAVVSSMAKHNDGPVNTCSISFGDPAYNESKYAQLVAERFRTDHRVELVDTDDFDLVERISSVYDEPFADSSAIPTYRVCQLARKHVTVALSGDGGDELLAGYRRYRWHLNEERVRQAFPAALRRTVFRFLGAAYPKLDWAPRVFRAKSTFEAIARESASAYLHSVSILPNDVHGRLFSSRFNSELQDYSAARVFDRHLSNCGSEDPLSIVQYLDIKTYLPGDILTKVDRASMANSLEVRAPLLDSEFAAWVCTLPSDLKLRGREGKYLFKKAFERRLPEDILYREKMGFAVPLAKWFRGPLRSTVRKRLLGESMHDSGIFDMDFVETLLDQHVAGVRDHSPPIWALLVFENFYRELHS